jgi:16S rRNA processing protein RimM
LPAELVEIGMIVGPHGIRGEVKAHVPDPSSSTLLRARRIMLRRGSEERVCTVVRARPATGNVLVSLEGVHDRNAAELLRGFAVFVSASDMPPTGKGEYYLHQLRGMAVRDASGKAFGFVTTLSTNNAQDLLVMETSGGREVMIPFVDAIVREVRVDERVVVIDPPEGLLD